MHFTISKKKIATMNEVTWWNDCYNELMKACLSEVLSLLKELNIFVKQNISQ